MRIFSLFLAIFLAASAQAQPRFGLNEADYALAQRWLRASCLAPDARPLIDALSSRRTAMQTAFAGALAEGPTADEIAAVRGAAANRWRAQRAFLDDAALKDALSEDQRQALRSQSEDAATRSEVENFINGYKSNAMSGLAIVGDGSALDRLREISMRGDAPEALAARAALAYRQSLPKH